MKIVPQLAFMGALKLSYLGVTIENMEVPTAPIMGGQRALFSALSQLLSCIVLCCTKELSSRKI